MLPEEKFISVMRGSNKEDFDKYYEIKNGNHCFVFKEVTSVTPIWYSLCNSSKKWSWSPDGVTWMGIENLIITGGYWVNRIPALCNIRIIEMLRLIDTRMAIEYLVNKSMKLGKKIIIDDTNDRPECIICLDKTAVHLAQPCNHLLYCNNCYYNEQLCKSKCAICNMNVTFSKIFF